MKKSKFPFKVPPARSADQPASRAMLYSVKEEIKSELIAMERRVEARFAGLKTEISELKSEIAGLKTSIHKSNVLVEEQNSNNRIVLEGLQAVWQRQNKLEGVS